MVNQLTLFDVAQPQNAPRYSDGQAIYRVVLDVIESYVVSGNFSMGPDIYGDRVPSGQTLWRYHLDNTGRGGHNVFGEYEMEGVWFDSLDKAQEQAERNRQLIEKAGTVIRADRISATEPLARQIAREDGYVLTFQVARVKDCAVYEKKLHCYPFLRVYSSEREAKKCYDDLAAELKREGGTPTEFKPVDLYRVSDKLWAGYEYAERNGKWGFLYDRQDTTRQTRAPTISRTGRSHER